MVSLFTGNEPYKIKCEIDRIKKEYGELGVSEYDVLTNAVYTDCLQTGLLADRKAVIVHCGGVPDTDGFVEYLKNPSQFTDLFLIDEQMDKRSAVYKACKSDKYGVVIRVMDKVSQETFVSMCMGMIKRRGFTVCETTLQRLYEYTGYAESAACNLFDISIIIKQMCYQTASGAEISPDLIEVFATPCQDAVVWELSDALFSHDGKKLLALGEQLLANGESPIAMLSALLRQFRLAYKIKQMRGSDRELSAALGVQVFRFKHVCSYREEIISQALHILQKRVNDIKGGTDAVTVFRAALCETQLLLGE